MLGWIAPQTLLGLVKNTAPYLFAVPASPAPGRLIETEDFLDILNKVEVHPFESLTEEQQLEDYFALCLSCHHATVATFVPTDVDSKIRGLIWRRVRDRDSLRRMFHFTRHAHRWTLNGISKRATDLAELGPVSGHDGEILSVYAAALGGFLRVGDSEYADLAAQAIHDELEREAKEFRFATGRKGHELDALRIAATLTHNAGDLDQGLSFWPNSEIYRKARTPFERLAHENKTPYGGTYQSAARVYKAAMACEGHRNYPLRGVRALRQSPDLLLPLGPFLDDWGATIARHPLLTRNDISETVSALLEGCRKLPGQRGYFRAIHGIAGALGGSMEEVVSRMSSVARATWKDSQVRKEVAVPRPSFESSMRKMLAAALGN